MVYEFREIEAHDLADALSMFNAEMGVRYYSKGELIEHQRAGDLLIGVYEDGILVAANLSYFLSPGEMITNGLVELIPEHLTVSKLLYRKTTVVESNHRGEGIGLKLAQFITEIAKESVDAIITTAWDKEGQVRFPESLNMEHLGDIPNYWYNESEEKGFFCPSCGEPPCKCSAKVYITVL